MGAHLTRIAVTRNVKLCSTSQANESTYFKFRYNWNVLSKAKSYFFVSYPLYVCIYIFIINVQAYVYIHMYINGKRCILLYVIIISNVILDYQKIMKMMYNLFLCMYVMSVNTYKYSLWTRADIVCKSMVECKCSLDIPQLQSSPLSYLMI